MEKYKGELVITPELQEKIVDSFERIGDADLAKMVVGLTHARDIKLGQLLTVDPNLEKMVGLVMASVTLAELERRIREDEPTSVPERG